MKHIVLSFELKTQELKNQSLFNLILISNSRYLEILQKSPCVFLDHRRS